MNKVNQFLKNVAKLCLAVLMLTVFEKANAQTICPPTSCTPNPCFVFTIINKTSCDIVFQWGYTPNCIANPSFVSLAPPPGGSTTITSVGPCMSCGDNPCSCPTDLYMIEIGPSTSNEIRHNPWGPLTSMNFPSFYNFQYMGCTFNVTITGSGNSVTWTID